MWPGNRHTVEVATAGPVALAVAQQAGPAKRGFRFSRSRTHVLRSASRCLISAVFVIGATGISVAFSTTVGPIIPAGADTDPWTVTSTPGNGALIGVACVSSTDCWAVGGTDVYTEETEPGAGLDPQDDSTTNIEHWDGSSWSEVADPYNASEESILYGVTCVSSSDCWAVGAKSGDQPLIENWMAPRGRSPPNQATIHTGASCTR